MKKTFRDKAISRFTHIVRKNRLLKYPCLAVLSVVLAVYYVFRHFADNTKRYACAAFVVVFCMNSCSFSFAVFAERTGFIKARETYSAVVGDSDITLAVEARADQADRLLPEDDGLDLEYDPELDQSDVDIYTLDDILESGEDYRAEDRQGDEGQAGEAGEGSAFDASDWKLVLVNKQHPIPADYEFNLGRTRDHIQCDERIIDDLLLMMHAAKDDGVHLAVKSPYRTFDRQESNFNKRIKLYMSQGMSYMDAYKKTSQVITVPGCSEHEIGLALDITSDTHSYLNQEFGETQAGQWLAGHSYEYGFILRYPEGKEYITSIDYEPWHFRYVGREAAAIMHEEEICLEEFWDKYL